METVNVAVGDCTCPDKPHEEGDTIALLARPSLICGLEAHAAIVAAAGDGSLLAQRWQVIFVRHGAVGWNRLDADGNPVPFDVDAVLGDYALGGPVAEKADELYGDIILRPLLARLNGTSRTGPTPASTSPRRQSIRKQRGPSSPAITAGTGRSMR